MAPLAVLHLDTERGWRGGERQVLWLAEALERLGVRSPIAARGDELARRALRRGLMAIPSTPVGEWDPVAALKLRDDVRRTGAAVLHAHTGHAVMLGALATMGTSTKLVVTRRVDFPLRRNRVTRWKYGRAHALVAISGAVADVMGRSGCDRTRIDVVPDGVDLTRPLAPADAQTLRSLGVAPGAPLVVMVAALVDHKDPLNFVRAVAAARSTVPTLQALLVGDGPLRGAVDAAVAELGLAGTLHATGYRTDADALLCAADVFVLSSQEEGSGSVILDAMLWGRPIAATTAGGIPELVTHEREALLAPVRDADALGANVARLLRDRPLADRLVAAGRERVRHFSIDNVARRMIEIYERVVASPGG